MFALALEGAGRLGPGFVDEGAVEVVREFFGRCTARGRDPGHEARSGPERVTAELIPRG